LGLVVFIEISDSDTKVDGSPAIHKYYEEKKINTVWNDVFT